MKVARRVLSTFLSVLLVVTALPFTVMAGETDLDPFSYPLPTATVTEVTPAETDVVLFDFATKQPTDLKADLGAEYVFTPDAVSAEAMEYYKDWIGDFVVTADAALAAGSFGLYGAYGGNALAFVWPNDVAAGDSIFLLQTAGLDNHLTYQEIVTVVQAFTCGAFNLSDTNADTLHHLSVKFVLWAPGTDPATSPEAVKTVAEKEYDFADVTSVKYPLPTGTASEVTPAATDLPIYIVPAMTNTLRRTDLAAEYALAADAPEAGQKTQYKDWLVDVILSFEQDVASDSFGVYGKFGTVNTAFSWPANTAAGETASLFTLLGAAGTVKYQDLVDTIAAVNVGAFNLSAANLNNTMKIQLVIWDPALDPAQDPTVRKVLAETTYQFTDIQTVTEPQTHSMTVSASSYTVSENGAPATEQQTTSNWFNRPEGTTFDLSYTGEDEFHSWINESNNIVSTEKDYSVTLVRDTSLSAVSTGTYEDETEPTAFVIIKNAYKQIQASGRVTEFTINQLFSESGIPGKMGYDFDKWVFDGTEDEATVDAIAAKLSNTEEVTITIVPHYIQRQDTYVVTIQVIDQQTQETFTDDSLNEELNIGSRKDYVLSEVLDVFGKDVSEFSYWSMDGGVTPASYDANKFTVISTKDDVAVTIVLNAPAVEPSAFIAITQQYTSQANEKYIISTTMKFYVPDTDTVHESGFVYGLDGEKFGGQNAEDNLQIGKEGVSKHVAPSMTNDVIYTYNLRTSNPTGKTLYIRGFLIYEDTDGIHTIYTDVYSKAFLD